MNQVPTVGDMAIAGDFRERFWSKVDKGPHPKGCWLWTGAKNKSGYGKFFVRWIPDVGSRWAPAHVVAFEITFGIPVPDDLLRHKCDTPSCVKPWHLKPGTKKDNSQDMVRRGRSLVGERNPMVKLNANIVRRMKAMYFTSSDGFKTIGSEFGVCADTCWRAVTGRSFTKRKR